MRKALALILLMTVPARSDETSTLKAIQHVFGQKIIAEMNTALACQMAAEADKEKIAALEGRIKELEAKKSE